MNGRIVLAGILLVLFATFGSAFSLDASADQVVLQGTEGRVTLTALNDAGANARIAFSANLGEFTGAFDTPLTTAAPLQTVGTTFRFRAPDDFEGVKELTITAQACTLASTPTCKTATKRLTITAYSNREPGTRHGLPYTEPYAPAQPANTRYSTVQTVAAFPSTGYAVDVTGPALASAPRDQLTRVKLTIANRGAARTFGVRAQADEGTGATVFPDSITLQRGEAAIVFIDVVPRSTGAHTIKLFVSADGRTVPGGYSSFVARTPDERDVTLRLEGDAFSVAEGERVLVRGAVVNDGTRAEDVTLSVGDRFTSMLSVPAGSAQPFELEIDSAQLGVGEHLLRVVAEGRDLRGEGALRVTVKAKAAATGDAKLIPISVVCATRATRRSRT